MTSTEKLNAFKTALVIKDTSVTRPPIAIKIPFVREPVELKSEWALGWYYGDKFFAREALLNNISNIALTIGTALLTLKEKSLALEIPAAWLLFFGATLALFNKAAKIHTERQKQDAMHAQIADIHMNARICKIEISKVDEATASLEMPPSDGSVLVTAFGITFTLFCLAGVSVVKVGQIEFKDDPAWAVASYYSVIALACVANAYVESRSKSVGSTRTDEIRKWLHKLIADGITALPIAIAAPAFVVADSAAADASFAASGVATAIMSVESSAKKRASAGAGTGLVVSP